MKIKVIDLINMHARNEEMPKQIKLKGKHEILTYNGRDYMVDDIPLYEYFDFFNYLNAEVEIIEEDKKIEFLRTATNDKVLVEFKDKLNEVIDAVNKLKVDDKD